MSNEQNNVLLHCPKGTAKTLNRQNLQMINKVKVNNRKQQLDLNGREVSTELWATASLVC